MPITCGSIGDIISLSILIKDIVKCLDDSRGSSAEYQATIRELWNLDCVLLQVELLFHSCEQTTELNALRTTANRCAEQCRDCITVFGERITRYQRSLRSGSSGNFFRDATAKIMWQVSEKDDLAKFRAQVNAHCISINMLLATTGVQLITLNDEHLHKRLKRSEQAYADSLATNTSLLAEIRTQMEENRVMMKEQTSGLKDFASRFDVEYLHTLGADTTSLLQNILQENMITYKAVTSLQSQMPSQLERCWTQEPAILEDALGRITPVHLEFIETWEAFEAVLEVRFRQLPGHRKIEQREYALRANSAKEDLKTSVAFSNSFRPNQRISMCMIFDDGSRSNSSCPGCKLVANKTLEELQEDNSQIRCLRCGMWYQRIIEPTPEMQQQPQRRISLQSRKRQRQEHTEEEDEPGHFRRVRMRCWTRHRKNQVSVETTSYGDRDLNSQDRLEEVRGLIAIESILNPAITNGCSQQTTTGTMCIQVIERYAVCRCLFIKHPPDSCAKYPDCAHDVAIREVLVGYTCEEHSTIGSQPSQHQLNSFCVDLLASRTHPYIA